MSTLTKQAIIDCAIELAEQKPLRKITVNDVTKQLGITRNAFYYHFKDIYDVFDQIIGQKLEVFENITADTFDKEMFDLIEFAIMHKKVWKNLYKSLGHEQLSLYVNRRLHTIFKYYAKSKFENADISATDLYIIFTFYEEALFGVLTRWVCNDNPDNPDDMHLIADRIRVLFEGSLELMIANSQKKPQDLQET